MNLQNLAVKLKKGENKLNHHLLHFYSVTTRWNENHGPKCLILIFQFWHFPPVFVLLNLTCLVTLFDRKLYVFKNSPNWAILASYVLDHYFCSTLYHQFFFSFLVLWISRDSSKSIKTLKYENIESGLDSFDNEYLWWRLCTLEERWCHT